MVVENSRAEYFRERRKTVKHFTVNLPVPLIEALDNRLKEQNKTRTAWVLEKIDEELGNIKK